MAKGNTITIPEGKKIVDAKVVCSKHGDITDSAFYMDYTTNTNGMEVQHKCIYCIACVDELLQKFTKSGELGTIGVVPIVEDIVEEPKQEETPAEDK